jgi:peptidoglycan/LPS O-acetylase OafA/YrhL
MRGAPSERERDLTTPIEGVTMDTTHAPWTTRNKVGLGLAILYGVTSIPSFLTAVDEGETGPPLPIMIVSSVLGLVAVVAGLIAWRRRSRPAARLTAASVVVITLTSLPAFFVDVPAGIKALVAFSVLFTVVTVVLMLSTAASSRTEVSS